MIKFGISIGLLVLTASTLSGCDDPCGNKVVSEAKSPDGKLKAVVFARDCGALTSFSTQISILPNSQISPRGKGNLFIADDNGGVVPLDTYGAMNIKLSWESNKSLIIRYPQKAEVFLQNGSAGDVTVRFEAIP